MKALQKFGVGVAAALCSALTFAQSSGGITIDTTPISDVNTQVLAIGAAVFGVFVSIKLYKWARRAL